MIKVELQDGVGNAYSSSYLMLIFCRLLSYYKTKWWYMISVLNKIVLSKFRGRKVQKQVPFLTKLY